jgi:hypothetical protein
MTDTTPNPRPIATMMAMPPQPSISVLSSAAYAARIAGQGRL